MSGTAIAHPICEALYRLEDASRAFGAETLLKIDTYFELYSEGGEAAVAKFHAQTKVLADLLDAGPALTITGG